MLSGPEHLDSLLATVKVAGEAFTSALPVLHTLASTVASDDASGIYQASAPEPGGARGRAEHLRSAIETLRAELEKNRYGLSAAVFSALSGNTRDRQMAAYTEAERLLTSVSSRLGALETALITRDEVATASERVKAQARAKLVTALDSLSDVQNELQRIGRLVRKPLDPEHHTSQP